MTAADPELTAFLARLPIASRAAEYAAEAHAGQRREADGAPFLTHPLEVALILHCAGYGDEVVAGAVLHDVVEKSPATLDTVEDAFGPHVTGIVDALTEDDTIRGYGARKLAAREKVARAPDDALAVFAADKLSKAHEVRVAAAAGRLAPGELADRRAHYAASLVILEERLPEHPFTDALRFELALYAVVPELAEPASPEPAGR